MVAMYLIEQMNAVLRNPWIFVLFIQKRRKPANNEFGIQLQTAKRGRSANIFKQ